MEMVLVSCQSVTLMIQFPVSKDVKVGKEIMYEPVGPELTATWYVVCDGLVKSPLTVV